MPTPLQINDLSVKRGSRFNLKIFKLKVASGKILGVVGPNGSGKTTLLESLIGALKLESGSIRIDGKLLTNNIRDAKSVLGYIPDDDNWFIPELTAGEYFKLLQKVYQDAGGSVKEGKVEQFAKLLNFSSFDQRLDTLSHGNKKKVQLIAGLMHEPKIIIIDELRNGLDPIAIIAAEKIIRNEAERGAAIVAASHDLWWAQRVTDETLLLQDGKVQVLAPTKALVQKYGSLEKLFIRIADGLSKT